MTLKHLAKIFNIPKARLEEKASEMLLLSELRKIETEIFSISQKYGVRSVVQMDKYISSGKLSEENIGEDFFMLDYLVERKQEIEKILNKSQERLDPWAVMTNFRGLPKLSLGK